MVLPHSIAIGRIPGTKAYNLNQRIARKLCKTSDTVGLWQFDGSLADSSGFGNDFTVANGAAYARYTDLYPGFTGYHNRNCVGSINNYLTQSAFVANHARIGADLTVDFLGQFSSVNASSPANLVSCVYTTTPVYTWMLTSCGTGCSAYHGTVISCSKNVDIAATGLALITMARNVTTASYNIYRNGELIVSGVYSNAIPTTTTSVLKLFSWSAANQAIAYSLRIRSGCATPAEIARDYKWCLGNYYGMD